MFSAKPKRYTGQMLTRPTDSVSLRESLKFEAGFSFFIFLCNLQIQIFYSFLSTQKNRFAIKKFEHYLTISWIKFILWNKEIDSDLSKELATKF